MQLYDTTPAFKIFWVLQRVRHRELSNNKKDITGKILKGYYLNHNLKNIYVFQVLRKMKIKE